MTGKAFERRGAGRPLVFLHGVGGGAASWRPQLVAFEDAYDCIALNLPGYGGSLLLNETGFDVLAAWLQAMLADLSVERPVLVGHSIGGMVVQRYLAQNPGAARACVLSATSPAFGRADGDFQRRFLAERLGPLDRGQTMADLAPAIVASLVGDDPDPAGVEHARVCMAAVPEPTYRAMLRCLVTFEGRAALPGMTLPALLLAGERDGNAPPAMMHKMAQKMPAARCVVLPGAGHLANLERPAAFNAALRDFLGCVDKPR